MNFLFLLLFSAQISILDINLASLEEIKRLPIGYTDAERISKKLGISLDSALSLRVPEAKAESIYVWLQTHGPLNSYYELLDIPIVDVGDLKRWRSIVVISKVREGKNFSLYVERVRERGASEEAPRESYFDEWIGYLTEPININEATVDELYSLYRVSLIDAASVVAQAKVLRFRNSRDLRRAEGLSHYGYLNMRNFVTYRPLSVKPVRGWVHIDSYFSPYMFTSGSALLDRINQLEQTSTYTLDSLLRAQGWTDTQINNFLDNLKQEKAFVDSLYPRPSMRVKARLSIYNHSKVGFLYNESPYFGKKALFKGFVGLTHVGPISKLIVGNYRLTLDQGLMIDNTEETRDRILDRPQGLYGDQTSQQSFNLRGVAAFLRYRWVNSILWYSNAGRHFILKNDGAPNFYYTSSIFPPNFRDNVNEKLYGIRLALDLPQPIFPTGTQIAFTTMSIHYDQEIEPDFQQLDLPGDRYDLGNDGSFYWIGGKVKRFYGISARWVKAPVSMELESAKEQNGGTAFLIKSRFQSDIFYFNLLYRHYPVTYTNPYMRPFQEDTRFEDTELEYEYRLLDPMYSELVTFPMPKPETGIFFETRYQFTEKFLTPRTYFDIWRDNTDGLINYRIQAELEFRPVYPLRLRIKQKWQNRRNPRQLDATSSLTRETTFRAYALLSNYDFFGMETRFASVDLRERRNYPKDEINGGFVAFNFRKNLSRKSELNAGYIVWRTNGLSQWAFEDTGIDFLYGNGSKFYLSLLLRPTTNLGLKLKVRFKNSIFPHDGLFGQGIYDPSGKPVLQFVETELFHSIYFSMDYSF